MEKTIKFNREDKDFSAFVDGKLVGVYASHIEAQNAADNYVYEALRRQSPAATTTSDNDSHCDCSTMPPEEVAIFGLCVRCTLGPEDEPQLLPPPQQINHFELCQSLAVEIDTLPAKDSEHSKALRNAAIRAVQHLLDGVWWGYDSDVFSFQSESSSDRIWDVTLPTADDPYGAADCNCTGFSSRGYCWHIPAARMLLRCISIQSEMDLDW